MAVPMMRDAIIRRELHKMLITEFENDPSTRIVNELSLCESSARIDVAAINGYLHGYEIKSEFDTLQRLPSQANIYGKVFDFLTIVTGPKHLQNLRSKIPKEWGILVVEVNQNGKLTFKNMRDPKINKRVNAYEIAQLLWREEALSLLTEMGLEKGYKKK